MRLRAPVGNSRRLIVAGLISWTVHLDGCRCPLERAGPRSAPGDAAVGPDGRSTPIASAAPVDAGGPPDRLDGKSADTETLAPRDRGAPRHPSAAPDARHARTPERLSREHTEALVDDDALLQVTEALRVLDDRVMRANLQLDQLREALSKAPSSGPDRRALERALERIRQDLREAEDAVEMQQRALEVLKFRSVPLDTSVR